MDYDEYCRQLPVADQLHVVLQMLKDNACVLHRSIDDPVDFSHQLDKCIEKILNRLT